MFRFLVIAACSLPLCLALSKVFSNRQSVIANVEQIRQLRCGANDCIGMQLGMCEDTMARDCDGGDCYAVPSDPSQPVCNISEQLENRKGQYPTCIAVDLGHKERDDFEIPCFGRFACSSYCEPDGMGGWVCAYNDSYPPYSEPKHMAPACLPKGASCPVIYASNELDRYRMIAKANGL
jgi:hypothetical protein